MSQSTADRARALAAAARNFNSLLGEITPEGLLELVRCELGHPAALDDFQVHGGNFSQALAPATILHVISGNTPHAGLQSLLRGLLLGSHNLCKLPGAGLPELEAFRTALPPELAARVELSPALPAGWVERADALIVFGSDATVEEFRRQARADQIFVAHGHRVSLGIIFEDIQGESLPLAARSVSLFDQQGCLSPQLVYVRQTPTATRLYAEKLAGEMARCEIQHPRARISVGESASIHALREDWRFCAGTDPERHGIWQSAGSTAWTVLYDGADPAFTASPLNRTVFVKPLPADLRAALRPVKPFLSALGIFPAHPANARWLAGLDLGVSRICPLDAMQLPPLTWHQDGQPILSSLVRWVDFEASSG